MSRSASWLLEPDRRGRLPLAVAVVVVVTFICGSLASIGALGGLTQQLSDTQYPTGPIDPALAIVELPASSLEWDRQRHAELIDALAAGGASVIGYDVVFDGVRSGTFALAEAIERAGNVVLVASASLSEGVESDVPLVNEVVRPTRTLDLAAAGVAHGQVVASQIDSRVRNVPLVAEQSDRRYLPALSLATVLAFEGQDARTVTVRPETGVAVGSRFIPTGAKRFLEVHWAYVWSSTRSQMPRGLVGTPGQVLDGTFDVGGKLVFVGVASTVVDWYATPVNHAAMPGVHIHANAANTLLTRQYRQGINAASTLATIAMFAMLVAAAGIVLRLIWVPAVAVALLFAWQARVNLAFQTGQALDPLWPSMAIIGSAVGVVSARYVRQRREREKVAGLFGQYVPQQVVAELLASGEVQGLAAGRRVEVTVLFSDLRGFTATAATLEPSDVRTLLEVYYDHSTRIIQEHGGTVMQFVGDEVFAVFGAPLPQPDHAQRAVDAARALQAAHGAVNAELAQRNIEIAWGIGLNTGEVVAAHVGSQVHKQYAVVGQAVNVGARLCSQAGPGEIVLSRWTREKLTTPAEAESLGPVSLKGVAVDPEPARLLG